MLRFNNKNMSNENMASYGAPMSIEPCRRVKLLANFEAVELVDSHVPIHRYFRSGREMIRMAKMYHKDNQLEKAFILYSKYLTIFIEKLPKHPQYAISSGDDRAFVRKTAEEMFPEAEKIKVLLLNKYQTEYEMFQHQQEMEKVKEAKELPESLPVSPILSPTKYTDNTLNKVDDKALNVSDASLVPATVSGQKEKGGEANVYPILSFSSSSRSPSPRSDRAPRAPKVDRSTKPVSLLSSGPETDFKHGFRLVVLPSSLMHRFRFAAEPNTLKDVETCGILAGKMVSNQFIVTHIIIPKQMGTPHSCTTTNEEDIFLYQDKYNLLTIGWIHTHPTQTAFMSSVDLHTQYVYQVMLPEAIAVVTAPSIRTDRIYNLTTQGLLYIANCQGVGFHEHEKIDIYEESPHIIFDQKATLVIADLREF